MVGHNFHKAFGHIVCACHHCAESEQEELSRMSDDFRALYQVLDKALESEDRETRINLLKKTIDGLGNITDKLMDYGQEKL